MGFDLFKNNLNVLKENFKKRISIKCVVVELFCPLAVILGNSQLQV